MKRKTLFMETTKIAVEKTAGEVVNEIRKVGATSVNQEFSNGQIAGMRWIMPVNGRDLIFEMPVRVDPILKKLPRPDKDQAARIAWRQLLRWVQAQNAMIDCGMVKPHEVYAPYMLTNGGKTLFSMLEAGQLKQLEAAK